MRLVPQLRTAAVALAFTAAFGAAGAVTTLATADAAPVSLQHATSYTFTAGPVEIDATVDAAGVSADVVTYLDLPVYGKVKVNETHDGLKDGVTASLGYSDVLKGSGTVAIGDGKSVVLAYDFVALGHHYSGTTTIGYLA